MATDGKNSTWTFQAAEDLNTTNAGTGQLYKAVAADDRKIANNGAEASGILTYGGLSAEHVTVVTQGQSKFIAGGAISAGGDLSVATSGYIIAAGSGDAVIGQNLETAVASGAVGTGLFDFANRALFDISSATNASYPIQTLSAKADLSAAGDRGKAISIDDGDFADDANLADGVIVTGTTSGGNTVYTSVGFATLRAGNVITKQRSLTVTSGWCLDANSGDLIIGRALEASAAGNSGGTFDGMINFATPHYATSCLDVQY